MGTVHVPFPPTAVLHWQNSFLLTTEDLMTLRGLVERLTLQLESFLMSHCYLLTAGSLHAIHVEMRQAPLPAFPHPNKKQTKNDKT